MRDVKFRGYQQALGYFVEGSYLYTPQETNDDGIAHWIVREDGFKYAIMNPETIGRYTGLNDDNGVDMFEGSIVKFDARSHYHPDVKSWEYETKGVGIIRYEMGSFLLGGRDKYHILETLFGVLMNYEETDIEVIGNIYENPELIEEDNNAEN